MVILSKFHVVFLKKNVKHVGSFELKTVWTVCLETI